MKPLQTSGVKTANLNANVSLLECVQLSHMAPVLNISLSSGWNTVVLNIIQRMMCHCRGLSYS